MACLDQICSMLDKACDLNNYIYVLGDINIDWSSNNCSLNYKLRSTANTLTQMVPKPTGVSYKANGTQTAKCTDLLFNNAKNLAVRQCQFLWTSLIPT